MAHAVNFAGPHDPVDITERMQSTVRGRTFPQPIGSTQLTPEAHNAIRQNYTAMIENIDRLAGLIVHEVEHSAPGVLVT